MLTNSNRVDDVNTVIPYRFTFMDSKERATNSISEQCNPTFNFATHIPIPTVTAHHLKYFEDGALQINVWAKRIPVNTTQTERLSTTELINKFRIDGGNRGKEALRRRSKAVAILPFGMMRSGLGGGEGGSSTLGNRKGDDNSEGAIEAAGGGSRSRSSQSWSSRITVATVARKAGVTGCTRIVQHSFGAKCCRGSKSKVGIQAAKDSTRTRCR